MLYDPKWDKTPSLAGFKLWLLQQNPDETFKYSDCVTCAVGRYLASLGRTWQNTPLASTLNKYPMAAALHSHRVSGYSFANPTFGEVLKAMERLGD